MRKRASQRLISAATLCLLFLAAAAAEAARWGDGDAFGSSGQELSVSNTIRQLLQDYEDALVYVSQPRELEDAILQGRRHIVITTHLDMTSMPLRSTRFCSDGCKSTLPEIRTTSSIRGECVSPPSDIDVAVLNHTPGAAELLPFQDKQCLVITHDDLFHILSYRMWLDNLYLRGVYHNAELERRYNFITLCGFPRLQWPLAGQGKQWITRSTFQGDGLGPAGGLLIYENAYIENCTFANLGGRASPACGGCTGNVNAVGAPVRIVNSTFFDPVPVNYTSYLDIWGNGSFLLTGCVFGEVSTATEPPFYTGENGEIFSDDASIRVLTDTGPPFAVSPIKDANRNYLTRTDKWFVKIVAEFNDKIHPRPAYPAPLEPVARLEGNPNVNGLTPTVDEPVDINDLDQELPQQPASPPPNTVDPGVEPAVIAGGAVAGVLLLCAIAVCCVLWLRRRRRRSGQEPGSKAMQLVGSVPYEADMTKPGGSGGTDHDGISLPSGKSDRMGSRGASAEHTRAEELQGGPARTLLEASAPHWSTLPPSQVISTTASTDSRQAADVVHTAHARSAGGSVTSTSADVASLPDAFARHKPAATSSGPARTMETVTDTCTYGMALKPQKKPEPGATMTAHMDFLHYQLDRLLDVGREVLDGLVLEHGQSNRMQGGQAVIQFAKDRRSSLHYALKFFVSRDCFNDEAALYTNEGSPLGPFLPQLRNIAGGDGADPVIVDPDGMPLPPCIVIEKGESLDVWMQRNRGVVDMVTGLQVIQHVAERLADLHSAGFVHRDLKLSNIMWLPRKNRWTLIDFGCAARSGEEAPVRYSLKYAAPEVVRAVSAGDRTIVAQASMDAWSLGVVAIELFCKRNAVDVLRSREQVFACMLNNEPLPWEVGAKGTRALLRQLGIFQGAVLALLDRDAEWRLGVPDFIARCSSVLERTLGEEGPPEHNPSRE